MKLDREILSSIEAAADDIATTAYHLTAQEPEDDFEIGSMKYQARAILNYLDELILEDSE